ncbi:MAG TPA: non-heme iron oxygenase ferredoxin subunit [Kiritimatiellia bacterium]|jgi:3-phenylpropionate/trans-cinnamate dioxygenase ferredoxin subunit
MSDWVEVAAIDEFKDTDRKLVDLGGDRQIGLFKLADEFFAVSAWCSHQKSSLVHGDVYNHEIECPLHGARFDLRTGQHRSLPAVRPIARYDVKVEDGKVLLKI